jgi:hypothetical protein
MNELIAKKFRPVIPQKRFQKTRDNKYLKSITNIASCQTNEILS